MVLFIPLRIKKRVGFVCLGAVGWDLEFFFWGEV